MIEVVCVLSSLPPDNLRLEVLSKANADTALIAVRHKPLSVNSFMRVWD